MMASWYAADASMDNTMRGSLGGSNRFDTGYSSNSGVDVNHLSIFLALHVDDVPVIPTSTRNTYDTFWPSASLMDREESINGNLSTSSPMHGNSGTLSPMGSLKQSRSFTSPSKHPPTSSPVHSPRSPKASAAATAAVTATSAPSPNSPKRNVPVSIVTTPQTRSAAQHMFSLKQKLPFLIKVISTDELMSTSSTESSPLHDSMGSSDSDKSNRVNNLAINVAGLEFMISRTALDSLSLVIAGGWTKADNIKKLSNLHPYWLRKASSNDDPMSASASLKASGRRSEGKYGSKDDLTNVADSLCYSELSTWLDDNLTINDILFPISNGTGKSYLTQAALLNMPCFVSLGGVGSVTNSDFKNTTAFSPRSAKGGGGDGSTHNSPRLPFEETTNQSSSNNNNNNSTPQIPFRHTGMLSDVRPSAPTVVKNCASTVIYTVNNFDTTLNSTLNGTRTQKRSMSMSQSQSQSRLVEGGGEDDDDMEDIDISASTSPSHLYAEQSLHNFVDTATNATAGASGGSGGGDGSLSSRSNKSRMGGDEVKGVDQLPHAMVSGCVGAHIYLLSPYASATISHCCDCEIVLGVVSGALVISFCERVFITIACRKLFIVGSSDCRLNIATLSASVIIGDCRGLVIGPYNTTYKSLRSHLVIANLQQLITNTASAPPSPVADHHKAMSSSSTTTASVSAAASASSSNSFASPIKSTNKSNSSTGGSSGSGGSGSHYGMFVNHWSVFTDVVSCLESAPTAGSPSGYALDAASASSAVTLPASPASIAHQMPHDHFKAIVIPSATEFDYIQTCPIHMPMLYSRTLHDRNGKISAIRDKMLKLFNSNNMKPNPSTGVAGSSGSGSGNMINISKTSGKDEKMTQYTSISSNSSSSSSSGDKSVPADSRDRDRDRESSDHPAPFSLPAELDSADDPAQNRLKSPGAESTLPPSLNHTFMEWIIATGKSQLLMQLIRLDATDSNLLDVTAGNRGRAASIGSSVSDNNNSNSSNSNPSSTKNATMTFPRPLDLGKL